MNTIGRGNESWFVVMSAALMVVVGVLLTGGVSEFLSVIDSTLMGVARDLGAWIRSLA